MQASKSQVDYSCTPEEVQQHFQACGTVNRVIILTDKFGQPKGFSYVEFLEVEAIQEALQRNDSELHGRQLKVSFLILGKHLMRLAAVSGQPSYFSQGFWASIR